MDELNEAIQVFCGDLKLLANSSCGEFNAYGFILLLEVVDVAIEDFHEKFYRNCRVHARIGNSQGALKTFQNSLAVSVKLEWVSVVQRNPDSISLHFCHPLRPWLQSVLPTTNDLQDKLLGIDLAS